MHSNSSWEEIPRMPLVQQFLVSHFHQITHGSILAPLTPLSTLLDLFLSLTCRICQMSTFKSDFFHRCHSIFIIVVIEIGNLVEVSHQLQNDSISHVSYISSQILPMMHLEKCIKIITHPRTFRLPMDSKLQEEVSIWYQISSLCGSHILHVSS